LLLVDGFGVGYAKGLHDLRAQVIGFQIDHQVIVGRHQTIGQDVYQIGLEVVPDTLDEIAPILVTEKDGLTVYAAIV
jgi:hypothetical protein